MTLPTITAPPGTPVFLADGHGITDDSVFALWKPNTGHSRTRRVWTVSERIVTVQWFLEAEDLAAVDTWLEETLEAASLPFAARVRNQGDGEALLWWRARWVDYSFDMLPLGRARMSGRLFLTGEGSETGPDTSALAMEAGIALIDIRSSIELPSHLAMEVGLALLGPKALRMEASIALLGTYLPHIPDGGNTERIWSGHARTPVPGSEINRATQENLQRAWMGLHHGF